MNNMHLSAPTALPLVAGQTRSMDMLLATLSVDANPFAGHLARSWNRLDAAVQATDQRTNPLITRAYALGAASDLVSEARDVLSQVVYDHLEEHHAEALFAEDVEAIARDAHVVGAARVLGLALDLLVERALFNVEDGVRQY